jgi:hypothetical protein
MSEERANRRNANDMNEPSEHTQLFDTAGHLTGNALNELIDGSLPSPQAAQVQAHLDGCPDCATRWHELTQTVALLRSLPEIEPSRSFEIAAQPASSAATPAKPRFQTILTPAFPVLRVAVAAVFLLLVGVTATDLITQPDDDRDQVAMIAEPTAAPTEAVMRQEAEEAPEADAAPLPTGAAPAPAAAGASLEEAGESQEALPASEPSEAFSQAVADEDTGAADAGVAQDAADGADIAQAPAATPEIAPSPTAAAPESRVDTTEDDDDGLSNWRIAEIALLLLLFWLVVTWFGLERMRKR